MKMVLDERLKHRLVGVAVVLSLGAIFVPAILKNSSQRLHDNKQIAIKLPDKPRLPKISAQNEQALFKRMNVAHVELPKLQEADKPATTIARARALSPVIEADATARATVAALSNDLTGNARHAREVDVTQHAQKVQVASVALANASAHAVMNVKPARLIAAKKTPAPLKMARTVVKAPAIIKSAKSKAGYSVQLGLFSQQQNAIALMNKLKAKGYQSYLVKINGRNGTRYKVLAGRTAEKNQAKRLQQQLASAVKVSGFVVPGNEVG